MPIPTCAPKFPLTELQASMTTDRTNDGTHASPYLRKDINLGTILNLPHGSAGYRAQLHEQLALLKADGHIGAQSWNQGEETIAAGLRAPGMARITVAHQSDGVARDHTARGLDATTIPLGTRFESDAEIDALVASVLEAAARHSYPLYIESMRSVISSINRSTDVQPSYFRNQRGIRNANGSSADFALPGGCG